jgi:glucose dehydrogenase
MTLGAALAVAAFAADDDAEWRMAGKDYANTRYSALAQITPDNAASLKVVFTFSTGVVRGHEAAPIVAGDTMYIVTPFPNYLYALDLHTPAAPRLKWKFEPNPAASAQGIACCDTVNRGAAWADGRVFFNTLDDQTIAVDAASG